MPSYVGVGSNLLNNWVYVILYLFIYLFIYLLFNDFLSTAVNAQLCKKKKKKKKWRN